MELLSREIVTAVNAVKAARKILCVAVIDAQQTCKHENLAVHDRTRICLHCGMTEVGFCSYLVLINHTELGLPSVNYAQYCELRKGLAIKEHHKGPLIRGEITIAALIVQKH